MAATGVAEALVPQNSDDNNEESVKNLKSTANMASVEVPGPLPPSSSDDNVADTSQKMVEDTAEREKRGDGGLLSRVQTQTRWGELRGKRGVTVRRNAETKPMSWWDRFGARLQRVKHVKSERPPSQQYRIPPANAESLWASLLARRDRKRKLLVSVTSFDVLTLHFLVVYFVLISIFALLLQVFVDLYYNTGEQECVTNYDYSRVSIINTDNFLVLFGLSWTTFSTVGYGVIGVSTEHGCQALRYFLAIEAFFGVMYSGYCGALIFSNISGFLARAHVSFSSSICLQYGTGLTGTRVTFHKEGKDGIQDNLGRETPGDCPVIEMRLVNDRVSAGTAVIDATLQCIAVMKEDFATVEKTLKGPVVGDGDATVKSCRELEVTPSALPYFSHGSWYFQHVLNEHSPLLKESVRRRIKGNGGIWPSDLNEWSIIRDSFSENVAYIAVAMNGTSSLTSGPIFKSVQYFMEDVYIGYEFAELGYFAPQEKSSDDLAHCVRYDLSLINDIRPQQGGGNEPLGNELESNVGSSQTTSSDAVTEIDRRYVWRGGHRHRYDSLVRPQDATRGMRRSRRKWMNLSTSIRRCFRMNSSGEADDDLRQYTIPPRKEKRWLSIQDVFFPKQRPLVACVLWLYQTTLFNALLSMFLGYFVCIWIFALLVYAIDPGCLSGWDDVPGSFIHSFYIPFQASWTTFSTVGYGSVAPIVGESCRGLSLILAGEAFVGVLYSSFCGSIFYAKISRNESIANISFSSAACLQYGGGNEDANPKELKSTKATSTFPFLEMRILNEDAQYKMMQGQILNSVIKCLAISFTVKLPHETENSTTHHREGRFIQHSIDGDVHWLKVVPSRQVVFGEAPWSFRHVLDGTSPLLKPDIRKQIKDLGVWPPELNDHDKIRGCLSPEVHAIHILFKGTSNRTSDSVVGVHEYKPVDIFVGWEFAPLAYVEDKKVGDKTKSEVKFDRCLLNDIVPQDDGRAEPIHCIKDSDSDDSDD